MGVSKQRQKGTLAETAVVKWLIAKGHAAKRRALAGSADRGDVDAFADWTIEVKNVRSPAYPRWVKEALSEQRNAGTRYSVVLHKPHGVAVDDVDRWVAVMPAAMWLRVAEDLEL